MKVLDLRASLGDAAALREATKLQVQLHTPDLTCGPSAACKACLLTVKHEGHNTRNDVDQRIR